jgi:hypothetical protein
MPTSLSLRMFAATVCSSYEYDQNMALRAGNCRNAWAGRVARTTADTSFLPAESSSKQCIPAADECQYSSPQTFWTCTENVFTTTTTLPTQYRRWQAVPNVLQSSSRWRRFIKLTPRPLYPQENGTQYPVSSSTTPGTVPTQLPWPQHESMDRGYTNSWRQVAVATKHTCGTYVRSATVKLILNSRIFSRKTRKVRVL